jgi:hypothetical protein
LNNSQNISLFHTERHQPTAVTILFDSHPAKSNRLHANTTVWRTPSVKYRDTLRNGCQPGHFPTYVQGKQFTAQPGLKQNNPVALQEPKANSGNFAMEKSVQPFAGNFGQKKQQNNRNFHACFNKKPAED